MMSWLIKSNLYVSLCAASLAWVTYCALDMPLHTLIPPQPAVVLLFFATLFIYNLDRLSPASLEDHVELPNTPKSTSTPRYRHMMLIMFALSIPGMIWSALQLPPKLILTLVPLGLIAIAYSIPMLPFKGKLWRLKEVPGIKIFLIALVWAIATVTLPGWEAGAHPLSTTMILETISRLLFIFAITLPFDVRDMYKDKALNIQTIPIAIGVKRTRLLAHTLILVFALMQAFLHGISMRSILWPTLLVSIVCVALFQRLNEDQPEHYYSVYIEGTMGLYSALVVLWSMH